MCYRNELTGEFWAERVQLVLDPDLQAPLDGPVGRLFRTAEVRASAKWTHYFDVYDRFLGPLAGKNIRMLEIGAGRGGSLTMWQSLLGPDAVIVGADIRPAVKSFERDNIHIRIGSQSDPDFLRSLVDEFGPFDVILDDGSHVVSDQITSFEILYPDLDPTHGLYIVEDLHTNYWDRYRDARQTFIELMFELVHELHEPYDTIDSALTTVVTDAESEAARIAGKPLSEAPDVVVSRFAASTRAIHFFDSVVVLEKRHRYLPTHESLNADR